VAPDNYDGAAGARSYSGMVERLGLVETLGFDWVSVAEHHYSPSPDAGPDGIGGVFGGLFATDKDRRARPDRLAEQPGAGG
jgi:hypothetical protein